MKAVILEQAQKELQDAIEYYEGGQDGLGLRFLADFEEHVGWVKRKPFVPRVREGGYRRVNLKIFPYHVPYVVQADKLWILAVANSYREPVYWIGRKTNIR